MDADVELQEVPERPPETLGLVDDADGDLNDIVVDRALERSAPVRLRTGALSKSRCGAGAPHRGPSPERNRCAAPEKTGARAGALALRLAHRLD